MSKLSSATIDKNDILLAGITFKSKVASAGENPYIDIETAITEAKAQTSFNDDDVAAIMIYSENTISGSPTGEFQYFIAARNVSDLLSTKDENTNPADYKWANWYFKSSYLTEDS